MHWNLWLIVSLMGQGLFFMRFLVQWVVSEKKGESTVPEVFWYLSLGGGIALFFYALAQRDPVFMIGQSTGIVVYLRNLFLIRRKESGKSLSGFHEGRAGT